MKKPNSDIGSLSLSRQVNDDNQGQGNVCNITLSGHGKRAKKTLPHTAYDDFRAMSKSDDFFNKHDQYYLHSSSKGLKSSEEAKDILKQEKTVLEVVCTCPKRELPPSISTSLPGQPHKKIEKIEGLDTRILCI